MNTFYGKIDNKGDALMIGVEFLSLPKGSPPGYRSGRSGTLFLL